MSAEILSLAKQLETEGFVVVKNFFKEKEVEKAYEEIEEVYNADLREREKNTIKNALHNGDGYKSVLTEPTHLLLDVYGKSPTLDAMFEKILTDPFSSALLQRLAGGEIKIRGYNTQKLTGVLDEAPKVGSAPNPHEWHRDSPSEFCISIFLTDLDGPNKGATALIPKSHTYPYCPRWNCLFGPPYRVKDKGTAPDIFLKYNLINKIFGKIIKKRATGAYGKRGDFYIFINDMWHGREPNLSGQPGIKFMVGVFPIKEPFPDLVNPPSQNILEKLPPALKKAASHVGEKMSEETILKRIQNEQRKIKNPLFTLAKVERRIADKLAIWFSKN